jgi:HlyD family secretion protein
MTSQRPWRTIALALSVLALVAAFLGWQYYNPNALPDGFAASNGRIEAVEIDIATKIAGRIEEIKVNEGDFVEAGQVLAKMDTAVLEAQRKEAEAQLQQAHISIETAKSQVTQREAEKAAAVAVVAQRNAELSAASSRLSRTQRLADRGTVSVQTLDDDRAGYESANAAVSAAEAQVAASDAAIGFARSQVIEAQSQVVAVEATIERIQADIDDSALRAPRDGRVQYRVAELGEVLSAGGRVLNMVDLSDVYMTFFLPTADAGRVAIGSEVRLVLDAFPQFVIPAKATFVADVAQFTPKTVETEEERQKLTFRIKARISPDLLREHITRVKTGLPGMAYVRLDPGAEWPAKLQIKVPQ